MFKKEDIVMHNTAGVCRIEDIITKNFGHTGKKLYYILKPINENNSTIFYPVENESVKLRKLLTQKDINDLLNSVMSIKKVWINDDRARQNSFNEILKNGDHAKIIKMIIELHEQQNKKRSVGKKLRITDEKSMHDAENLIHQEFAYSLNLKIEDIAPYIMHKLNITKNA